MNANPFSASVPRHQDFPAVRQGRDFDVAPGEYDRDSMSSDGDTPFFPPMMLALVLIMLMTLVGLTKARGAEDPGAAVPAPVVVQMRDVETPGLLLRARRPGYYVSAPTIASDIDVDISGIVARTTVTQRFRNPSDSWVEGVYVFPLPDGAAVDTLRMVVGDRAIEGRIEERKAARRIFEKAKAEGRRTALIEQNRPNLFTNTVANIGPRETVVVQIEFQQEATMADGTARLRIPLVAAPRYEPAPGLHLASHRAAAPAGNAPGAGRDSPSFPVRDPAAGKHNPVTLSVRLDAGFPIDRITSSFHRILVDRTGEQTATLKLEDGAVPADRDFELTWAARAGAEPTASLFHEHAGDADYVLALIAPPLPAGGDSKASHTAREVVFVIDNSGSMAGASMRQAKAGLDLALQRLAPGDSFNIIRFDDTTESLFPASVEATPEHLAAARRFVAALDADGGTMMLPALEAALAGGATADPDRLRQVVFITDGAIGNEEQLFEEIVRNRGRTRIFTVGIGSAPNTYFMTRAAMAGRGTFTLIGSPEQVASRMDALFRKLERPAVTDLEAIWPDGADVESWPNPLPDLYAGEPVTIAARATSLTGVLTLRGRIAGRPWHTEIRLDKAVDGTGIAKLWARRKIIALEGRRYGSDNAALFDRAILETALDHGLVSRLTSLVAVDVAPARDAATPLVRRDVPLDLPAGWKFEKVFGPDPDARDARIDDTLKRRYASLLMAAPAREEPAAVRQVQRGIELPEGATLADRKILIGLLSIAFALMLAVAAVAGRRALDLFVLPPSTSR